MGGGLQRGRGEVVVGRAADRELHGDPDAEHAARGIPSDAGVGGRRWGEVRDGLLLVRPRLHQWELRASKGQKNRPRRRGPATKKQSSLFRAKPSKDGDAEARDYSEQ